MVIFLSLGADSSYLADIDLTSLSYFWAVIEPYPLNHLMYFLVNNLPYRGFLLRANVFITKSYWS